VEDIFKGVKTLAGANRRYRSLAMKWHPDTCRDTDAHDRMAELNRQYKAFVQRFKAPIAAEEPSSDRPKAQRATAGATTNDGELPDLRPALEIDDTHRLIDKGADLLMDVLGSLVRVGAKRLKRTVTHR
jgi:hypothetical protein